MSEEKGVSSVVVIGIGLGLGLVVVAGIAAMANSSPSVFTCPYCGAEFATKEELLVHIELEHPELPPLTGDFVYTEQLCNARPFPGATAWRQPLYSVTITNQGNAPGTRIITLHVRGTEYGDPWPGVWEGSWEQTLEPGQSVVVTARDLWPIGTFSSEYDGIPWAFGPTTMCYMHITDDAGGSTGECSV